MLELLFALAPWPNVVVLDCWETAKWLKLLPSIDVNFCVAILLEVIVNSENAAIFSKPGEHYDPYGRALLAKTGGRFWSNTRGCWDPKKVDAGGPNRGDAGGPNRGDAGGLTGWMRRSYRWTLEVLIGEMLAVQMSG